MNNKKTTRIGHMGLYSVARYSILLRHIFGYCIASGKVLHGEVRQIDSLRAFGERKFVELI